MNAPARFVPAPSRVAQRRSTRNRPLPLAGWRGQRVWLVGASTGIGAALAHRLHGLGAEVWVSARSPGPLAQLAQGHPGLRTLALDVTDAQAVLAAARQVLAAGPLDLVVYGAGHYQAMRAEGLDLAELRRHWRVNVEGAYHLLAAVLPALRHQGHGHLSLMASVAGYTGLPRSLAYGPTKAALINLAESLWFDLHPEGVDISLVNPGFVDTPLTAHNDFHMPALLTPDQAAQAVLEGWARGRFELHFPKRFTLGLKLLRLLPYPWYFALVRRITGL